MLVRHSNTQTTFHVHSKSGKVALAGGVAIVSYFAASLGGALILRPEMLYPLGPGCAVLVAILLSSDVALWPLLLLACLSGFIVYDLQAGLPARSIVLLNFGDAIEILIAVVGLQLAFKGKFRFNSIKSLFAYVILAVVLAPLIGAFIGPLSSARSYWLEWRISFLADEIGRASC